MKIAILTSGILPVPAVQGGAVENLTDFYLDYNNRHRLHDITVYSVAHPDTQQHPALQSDVNHYCFIDTTSTLTKVRKRLYHWTHRHQDYYHYSIEYFLHQAIKQLNKEGFDLIIVENRPGFVIKLHELTTIPCILHLHNDFLNSETKQAAKITNGYKCIVCVSDFIVRRVASISPEVSKKCVAVYNAIDLQRFKRTQRGDRSCIQLKDDDFVIVYSGRLTEDKGILPLIKAIKQTPEILHLKLMIVGASSYGKDKQPTSFIKQLQQESESIKDKVVFTGFIDYEKVPSLLKMADIAVVPSMWEEPFGLTVVEAMAAGLPLITTRSGGIPEICEGVATIVERENIVSNLASAILELYQHPEKRRAMSKAALQHAAYFDKERYAKDFFKAIETP